MADIILVNGLRLAMYCAAYGSTHSGAPNAAVSRSFRPTLSTGYPATVVATDGGLIPVAQQVGAWRARKTPSATRY